MFLRRNRPEPAAGNEPDEPVDSSLPEVTIDEFRGDPAARAFSQRLAERDWPAVLASLMSAPDLEQQDWRLRAHSVPDLIEWVDDFVRAYPDSPVPLTLKSRALDAAAGSVRGGGWARDVDPDAWPVHKLLLQESYDCIRQAIDRDPSFVPALTARAGLAIDRSEPIAEKFRWFEAITAIDPHNYYAHYLMLTGLTRKWGGSSEQMFRFARERAASAPDGSDLPTLIADAHVEEWLIQGRENEYFGPPAIGEELAAAAHRSILHPSYRFRPGLTPSKWNAFAFPLAIAERFDEAQRCFDLIGQSYGTEGPWYYRPGRPSETIGQYRKYVHDSIAYRNSVQAG